jgi:hypothetical protein
MIELEDCLELRDLVFSFDERIRYFGFMENRRGMIVSELKKKDLGAHPDEDQLLKDLTFFRGAMASWSLYFGRVNYSLVSHDRFVLILIPVDFGLVIVTAESNFPVGEVGTLSRVLREHRTASVVGSSHSSNNISKATPYSENSPPQKL